MAAYVYPGTKGDFYSEFGGLPRTGLSAGNIFAIFIVIILIIIIVVAIALITTRPATAFNDHKGFFNLDTLIDVNKPTVECCVPPGSVAPNQEYIYDTLLNITYSRQKPTDINIVCNTFPNPTVCIADNTDADGNIIPKVTFWAKPYYTFENGLFVGCASTTACV